MFIRILVLFAALVVTACSMVLMTGESIDYEYTDSIADLVRTENSGQEGDSSPVVDDYTQEERDAIKEISSINNTSSSSEVIEAINAAESSGSLDSTTVEFENFNIVESYEQMKSVNKDTVGWLNIPNIGSYPVMWRQNDNDFYLTHSSLGREFENGAIFMNGYCDGDFEDMALLHGHHLKSGGMFGSLKKYKDNWFFNTNDLIEVYDGHDLKYYRPFSVFFYEDGVDLIQLTFTDQPEKTKYVKSLLDKSMTSFDQQYEINTANDIMIMSTCDYEFENCRLGIACYEVISVPHTEPQQIER